jgi:hypothetical protein
LSLLGKSLALLGGVLVLIGLLLWGFGRAGGRLVPGDIYWKRDNFTLFFPFASCLAASLLATLFLWLLLRARR